MRTKTQGSFRRAGDGTRWIALSGATAIALALAGCAGAPPPADTGSMVAAAQSTEALLTAAEDDIAARRFQLALQRLAQLDEASAATPRAQVAIGEALLGLDRPADAFEKFEAAIADPAFHAIAVQGTGLALLASGDVDGSIARLELALDADPNLWRSWAALGRAHDQGQQWDLSAAAYQHGLTANPGSATIYNNIGVSYLLQHKYPEAASAFEQAIEVDPTLATARANLRIALAWQGQYEQALAGLQSAQRADALNNVGYVALLRGDRAAAQRFFVQAMEASPTYHQAAAQNLEALKLLAKVKTDQPLPQTADAPTP